MQRTQLASISLRIGLATAFWYAAVAGFFEPTVWSSFLPNFIFQLSLAKEVLFIFGLLQLVLGFWLIFGYKLRYAAILSIVILFLVILTNWSVLDLVFRDLAILTVAIALLFLDKTT